MARAHKLLTEADRLAWLRVWTRAEPLYAEAREAFVRSGDRRNALYAEVSRLRGQLPTLPVPEVSERLSAYLDDPVVQNDERLRLRVLIIKGETDEDLDPSLSQRSWTEALALAQKLGEAGWANRARGELGLVAFLQGDTNTAIVNLGQAIKVAETKRRHLVPGALAHAVRPRLRRTRSSGAGVRLLRTSAQGRAYRAGAADALHDARRQGRRAREGWSGVRGRRTRDDDPCRSGKGRIAGVPGGADAPACLHRRRSASRRRKRWKRCRAQRSSHVLPAGTESWPASRSSAPGFYVLQIDHQKRRPRCARASLRLAAWAKGCCFRGSSHSSPTCSFRLAGALKRPNFSRKRMICSKDSSRMRAAHGSEAAFSRAWTSVVSARIRLEGEHSSGDPSRLFAVLERARARSLVDLLHARPLSDVRKPEDLRKGERRIAALQLQLLRTTGRASRQRLLDEIFRAEEQLAPMTTELFSRSRRTARDSTDAARGAGRPEAGRIAARNGSCRACLIRDRRKPLERASATNRRPVDDSRSGERSGVRRAKWPGRHK